MKMLIGLIVFGLQYLLIITLLDITLMGMA